MTKEAILDILIDTLKDSAIVFLIVFIVHTILSFVEIKMADRLKKENKLSPFFGSLFGLIPQCGVSIIGADLFIKEHITMGTIVAIFISCSDEAIPLLFASYSIKSLYAILLLVVKFIVGFIVGFIVDIIIKDKDHVHEHLEHCHHEEEIHTGCCKHHIDDKEEKKINKYFIHPLLHSLKILLYVFIISFIFGIIVGLIGEDNISNFVQSNRYFAPILAIFIGMIPNCASSVLLAQLYIAEGIGFGALTAGLMMNAGLGIIYLFKNKEKQKQSLEVVTICLISSIVIGYIISIFEWFI